MLAYAAPRPTTQRPRPRTLALIVAGHALAIAAVMFAHSGLPQRIMDPPLVITTIELPPDPPQLPIPPKSADPAPSRITSVTSDVAPKAAPEPLDLALSTTPTSLGDGTGTTIQLPDPPMLPLPSAHQIVRRGPQMATAEGSIRPPYPDAKRMSSEEAVLTLKLSIDPTGRVVAVDPIGIADAVFLESARRHLLRVWRFNPATEDGRPVRSTKVITLHFQIDEE